METGNVPHLLIVAPNWLGDAVMSLPAIADVRRALPRTRIDIAARLSIAPLFSLVTGVNDVIALERFRFPGLAGDDCQPLRDRAYDAALLLPNSFQTALVAWRALIRERWGYRTEGRGPLLTRAVPTPAGAVHQAAYYQHLVRALGFPSGPLAPYLEASAEMRRAGADLLVASGWDRRAPLVALAPGAAYGSAKRWPADSFAALASALARDGVFSVLVGSPADSSRDVDAIAGINLIGRTGLPVLAGVLLQCRALVSNDSGAMHFAAALGVKVIALFGPTNEQATRPLGPPSSQGPLVLTHDVWCRPCMLRECPLTHRCMRGIGVEAVLAAVPRT